MTIADINKILSRLAENPTRENILDFSFGLLQWMNIEPNAGNKPQLLSPKTQKLKDFLATAPQTVQPQLYRISADNQNIRVRFAVLKKLKKEYISQLVDNDPGLGSYQSFSKGLIMQDSAKGETASTTFIPAQPYFIHFVTTPDYDKLVLIFNQGEQKRIVSFRNRLTNTQNNKIIQLWQSIGTKPKSEIADLLWKSLDIKEVNKEFYKQIKERFDAAVGIAKIQQPKAADADVKQFAVRLIGRYIFCWFLKEKGVIPELLLASKTIEANAEDFFQKYLYQLYFNTLNEEVQSRNTFQSGTGLDSMYQNIPYLNGGLFDKHPEDILFEKLNLNDWLIDFVKVLENFDFTVDESSSQYQHVAIDPEMLGRIFENLLASQNEETEKLANQRKAFGAFYTPREIVDYMVNESLKTHLETILAPTEPETGNSVHEPLVAYKGSLFAELEPHQTQMNLQPANPDKEKKRQRVIEKIEKLFTPDCSENPFDKIESQQVRHALSEVKILDPACGSGAFPMGVLLRLMELRHIVGHGHKNNYDLKSEILSLNIYGVDIMPMAVEIARLRAWLSLVLEAEYKQADRKNNFGISALPNLDFKFVCANSLIDSGYDEFLKHVHHNATLFRLDGEIQKLEHLRDNYFDPKGNKQKKELLQQEFIQTKNYIKTEFVSLRKTWNLGDFLNKVDDWNPFDDSKPSSFFSPAWMFGNRDGFDVVIGNPPYVNFRDIKSKEVKDFYFKKYKTVEYQSDLFVVFIEKAFQLLQSKKGNMAFIIPNSITNNLNNSKIRKFILKESSINAMVDAPLGVFENATVDTVILCTTLSKIKREVNCLQIINGQIHLVQKKNQQEFENNLNYNFDFLISKGTIQILKKIERATVILDSICDSSSGIKEYETGKGMPPQKEIDRENKVFNSENKLNKDYWQHLTGSEIENYVVRWSNTFLKYGPWLAAPRDIKYFSGERIIIREIPDKKRLKVAYTNENFTIKNTVHIFISESDKFSPKYLCAILNSLLIGFYFANKFSEKDDVFPKAKIGQCRLLPIKKIDNLQQQLFITRVDEILSLKKQNQDSTAIEKEIDVLVYHLYELTYDEVKIIDKYFWLSEEEYEKINKFTSE